MLNKNRHAFQYGRAGLSKDPDSQWNATKASPWLDFSHPHRQPSLCLPVPPQALQGNQGRNMPRLGAGMLNSEQHPSGTGAK